MLESNPSGRGTGETREPGRLLPLRNDRPQRPSGTMKALQQIDLPGFAVPPQPKWAHPLEIRIAVGLAYLVTRMQRTIDQEKPMGAWTVFHCRRMRSELALRVGIDRMWQMVDRAKKDATRYVRARPSSLETRN
jgi:hypothetical protein